MALRVKSGVVWTPPIASGKFRTKSGGVWKTASLVKVKSGTSWRDSGYLGPPNQPTALAVNSWDYGATVGATGTLSVMWTAPVGGTTPTSYELEIRDSNMNLITTNREKTASPSTTWTVNQDSYYQVWVRAKNAYGASAWTGPLKLKMGHPSSPIYGNVGRFRDWSTGYLTVSGYRGPVHGAVVPGGVLISRMYVNLWCRGYFSTVLSRAPGFYEGGDRQLYIVANGAYQAEHGYVAWNSPVEGNVWYSYPDGIWSDGAGQATGFYIDGYGWADGNGYLGNGVYDPIKMIDGNVNIIGYEYYLNYEQTGTNPAVDNVLGWP